MGNEREVMLMYAEEGKEFRGIPLSYLEALKTVQLFEETGQLTYFDGHGYKDLKADSAWICDVSMVIRLDPQTREVIIKEIKG